MKTWRYDVGRNVVVMTQDGILFAKTTWGNYTYKFETPGVDDFRKFFLDIVGQPRLPASTWSPKARYLIEKFTYDGPRGSYADSKMFVLDILGQVSKQIEHDLASEAVHDDG